MQEHAALSPTSSLDPGRSLELCGADQGRAATFHFSDGSRLVVVVTDAVALSCGGGDGDTRLEIFDPDGRVITRGNLAALLRQAGIG